jgi:hypothetical protein
MKRQAWLALYVFVFLPVGLNTANASDVASDADYCKVSSLPLDSSDALSAIRLSRTSFFGITREYSTASFELTSLSPVSIERAAVIVEYLDASDKVVVRIAFYATSTDEGLHQPPFALPSPQHLDKVIGPSDRVILVGTNPLTSLVCPTKGRVIFERVWLSNGTQEGSSSSVDLDVLPDVLPSYFDSTGCPLSSPLDVVAQFKIKPSGEASIVSVEGANRGQLPCLFRELRLWTFTPALRNGFPVESDVKVLIRLHSRAALPSDNVAWQLLRKDVSSSLTVVHLLQFDDNPDHWSILYAGGCCARVSRSRRLYAEP